MKAVERNGYFELEQRERKIKDLKIGETARIYYFLLETDQHDRLFAWKENKVPTSTILSSQTVKVQRVKEGLILFKPKSGLEIRGERIRSVYFLGRYWWFGLVYIPIVEVRDE